MSGSDPGFDPEAFIEARRSVGHMTMLGVRYAGHGADWAELSMPNDPRFADEHGEMAFGPIATLLDMSLGFSIWVHGSRFRPHATLDLRIDRVRAPAAGRTIIGHGEYLGLSGQAAFVRGYAHDGDPADPIAIAAGTFMLSDTW